MESPIRELAAGALEVMESPIRELAAGALGTIRITIAVLLLGGVSGLCFGLWAARMPLARLLIRVMAVALTITPFLAVLFWFHYPFQGLLGVVWPPERVVIVLLSVYVCVLTSDVFTHELVRAQKDMHEDALVLGIERGTFLWKIVAPSAAEASLPRLLSLAIATVHMTMFASLIGVEELFRAAQRVNAQTLRPVEVYGSMAFFYCAICLPLYMLAATWRRRIGKDKPLA